MNEEVKNIELEKIKPHPDNRKIGGLDQAKIAELARSIGALGVQQPAVVRPHPEKQGEFQIVAGERRFEASKLVEGVSTLPCVVRKLTDEEVIKIQAVENIQREDIHPLDEARMYQSLIDRVRYTIDGLSQELGKSKTHIYQRLKLLNLSENALNLYLQENINTGHASLLSRFEPEIQEAISKDIMEELESLEMTEWNKTVFDLREWIEVDYLIPMKKSVFSVDDAELLPDAGSCTNCAKRTGFEPMLFPEVGEEDTCTDSACYNTKLDNLLLLRLEELKEVDHYEVYTSYGSEHQEGKKYLAHYEWEECRKKDDGSKRAIKLDGMERGKLFYARPRGTGSNYQPVQKTPLEKARARLEKTEQQRRLDVRRTFFLDTIDAAEKEIEEEKAFPSEFLLLLARRVWDRVYDDDRRKMCKVNGWELPSKEVKKARGIYGHGAEETGIEKIEVMTDQELRTFLLKAVLFPVIERRYSWDEEKNQSIQLDTDLDEFAKLLNVSESETEKAVNSEYYPKIEKLEAKINKLVENEPLKEHIEEEPEEEQEPEVERKQDWGDDEEEEPIIEETEESHNPAEPEEPDREEQEEQRHVSESISETDDPDTWEDEEPEDESGTDPEPSEEPTDEEKAELNKNLSDQFELLEDPETERK